MISCGAIRYPPELRRRVNDRKVDYRDLLRPGWRAAGAPGTHCAMLLFQMEACMPIARDFRLGRRDFLRMASAGGLALGLGARPASAQEDEANFPGMLMFGEEAVFFSHLPVFGGIDPNDRTNYGSPHRYQVILEVALTQEQRNVYARDRKANPGSRFYTIAPEDMVLSHLFTPATAPQRTSFTCDIVRDHFERGGKKVPGLEQTQVKIARVVHGRKFDPSVQRPPALEYLLFGRGKERFLAHTIVAP